MSGPAFHKNHPPREIPKSGGASAASPSKGLGDLVHQIAGPIGRALHWPCLKGDGTTDLKPNSLCDRFRQKLNKL